MRYAAGCAFKRKKLGQPAEPRRSPDQSHWLRAFRAARRLFVAHNLAETPLLQCVGKTPHDINRRKWRPCRTDTPFSAAASTRERGTIPMVKLSVPVPDAGSVKARY
jgi:hypothetical protein